MLTITCSRTPCGSLRRGLHEPEYLRSGLNFTTGFWAKFPLITGSIAISPVSPELQGNVPQRAKNRIRTYDDCRVGYFRQKNSLRKFIYDNVLSAPRKRRPNGDAGNPQIIVPFFKIRNVVPK